MKNGSDFPARYTFQILLFLNLILVIIQAMLGEVFGKQGKCLCMVVGGGLEMVLVSIS
jgi:hypothetical protein